MKNPMKFKQVIFLFFVVSGLALLPGCAARQKYVFTPVTVPDIVKMSKDNMSSQNIINEIKKSHTAYNMKASEYAKLQQAGVADSVVNFMQNTQLEMARNEGRTQNSYYWDPSFGGYWYGPGYGWPYGYGYGGWNFGPSFYFRGGGGYHGGGFHEGGGGYHGGGGRGIR